MPEADKNATAQLTDGRALARSVVWNLSGQGLPLVVALLTIPGLVEGYGITRFGVLTLVWVAIGYFGLFDLGLSRALTQLVAKRAGQPNGGNIAEAIWTALLLMVLLGLIGGGLLAALTSWLIESVLTMPDDLLAEARTSFLLIAVSIPFLTASQGVRGVLEAHQKFNIVNAVRMPLSSFTFLGPFLLLPWTSSLVPAVLALVASRIVGGMLYLWFCLKVVPEMRRVRFRSETVLPLLRFGGWLTVSNIVGPLMVYLDRFLIGALVSLAATAYYSTPYDMVTRIWIVPVAIAGVLFPAFATYSSHDPGRVAQLFARGVKYTFIVLFPVVFLVVVFAGELLEFWLGAEFANASTLVLRILAMGVLANSLAHIPFALVQGIGRADLTAKLHLAEAPFYLAFLWWAVSSFGIEGAAVAWTLRVTADMGILFIMANRLATSPPTLLRRGMTALAAAWTVTALVAIVPEPAIKLVLAAAIVAIYLAMTWIFALSPDERRYLISRRASPR